MRHSMLLEKTMKRPLLLAVIATFGVVGCSSTPPARQVSSEQPRSVVVPLGSGGSPQCGLTNFDRNGNRFTIVNPTRGTANQQCFITVVSKQEWKGGPPDFSRSQLVEGNYEVTLSGGGGGGGGGAGSGTERSAAQGGDGGSGAVPVTAVRYLKPGVYRLTIGSGGQGGGSGASNGGSGGRGADGAPTSLSNASSGETVAGYPRAEYWDGTYPQGSQARSSGGRGADGARGGGGAGGGAGNAGAQGGIGFIRLAFKDTVPQPARAEPARVAPAPAASSETVTTPPPAATRPARRDRN